MVRSMLNYAFAQLQKGRIRLAGRVHADLINHQVDRRSVSVGNLDALRYGNPLPIILTMIIAAYASAVVCSLPTPIACSLWQPRGTSQFQSAIRPASVNMAQPTDNLSNLEDARPGGGTVPSDATDTSATSTDQRGANTTNQFVARANSQSAHAGAGAEPLSTGASHSASARSSNDSNNPDGAARNYAMGVPSNELDQQDSDRNDNAQGLITPRTRAFTQEFVIGLITPAIDHDDLIERDRPSIVAGVQETAIIALDVSPIRDHYDVLVRPVTVPGILRSFNNSEDIPRYRQAESLNRRTSSASSPVVTLGRVRPKQHLFLDPIPPLTRNGDYGTFNRLVQLFTFARWRQVLQSQWAVAILEAPRHCTPDGYTVLPPVIGFTSPLVELYADRGIVIDLRNGVGRVQAINSQSYRLIRYVRPSTVNRTALSVLCPVAMTGDLPAATPAAGEAAYAKFRATGDLLKLPEAYTNNVLHRYADDATMSHSYDITICSGSQDMRQVAEKYIGLWIQRTHAIWNTEEHPADFSPFSPTVRVMSEIRIGKPCDTERVTPYLPGYCPAHHWGNHMIPGSFGWLDPAPRRAFNRQGFCEQVQLPRLPIREGPTCLVLQRANNQFYRRHQDVMNPAGVRGNPGEQIVGHSRMTFSEPHSRTAVLAYFGARELIVGKRVFAARTLQQYDGPRVRTSQGRAAQAPSATPVLTTELTRRLLLPAGDVLSELNALLTVTGHSQITATISNYAYYDCRKSVVPWCTLIGPVYPPQVIPVQFTHLDKAPGYCKLVYSPLWLYRMLRSNDGRHPSITNAPHLYQAGVKIMDSPLGDPVHAVKTPQALAAAVTQLYGVQPADTLTNGKAGLRGDFTDQRVLRTDYIDQHQLSLAISNMTPPELMPRFPTDIVGLSPCWGDYLRYVALYSNDTNKDIVYRREPRGVDIKLDTQFFNVHRTAEEYQYMIRSKLIRRADRVYTSNGALLTFSIPIHLVDSSHMPTVKALKAMSMRERAEFGRVSFSSRNSPTGELVMHCAIPMSAAMHVIPFEQMVVHGVLLPENKASPQKRAEVQQNRFYTAMVAEATTRQEAYFFNYPTSYGFLYPPPTVNYTAGIAGLVNTTTWRSDMPEDPVTGNVPGTLLMHSGICRTIQNAQYCQSASSTHELPANVQTRRLWEPIVTPNSCRAAVRSIASLRCETNSLGPKILWVGQEDPLAELTRQGPQDPQQPLRSAATLADDARKVIEFSRVFGSVKVIDMEATYTKLDTDTSFGFAVDPTARFVPETDDKATLARYQEYTQRMIDILNTAIAYPDNRAYNEVVTTARVSLPLNLWKQRVLWTGRAQKVVEKLPDAHIVFRQGCLVGVGGLKRLLDRHYNTSPACHTKERIKHVITTNPLVFTGSVEMTIESCPTVTHE